MMTFYLMFDKVTNTYSVFTETMAVTFGPYIFDNDCFEFQEVSDFVEMFKNKRSDMKIFGREWLEHKTEKEFVMMTSFNAKNFKEKLLEYMI